MHIKLEVTASLPTHRIARSLWVPEFYTLEELANVLRAALGWEAVSSYCFRSGDTTWLPCDELENDIVEDGQFLAEGTTFSEVLNLWDADGTIFQTEKSEIWEFNIHIREVRETHPDNLTCILLDGHVALTVEKARAAFVSETLDPLMSRDTSTCQVTGKHLRVGGTLFAPVLTQFTKDYKEEVAPVVETPKAALHFELPMPTGELVMTDWLRMKGFK